MKGADIVPVPASASASPKNVPNACSALARKHPSASSSPARLAQFSIAGANGSWLQAPSALVRNRPRRLGWLVRSAASGAGALALAGLSLAVVKLFRRSDPGGQSGLASDRLYQGSALLSFSLLADSALEHYRGGYSNPAMFVGPVTGLLTLSVSLFKLARRTLPARVPIYAAAVVVGGIGLGFHLYNVGKREGGLSWQNVFYAAPLGAPAAASLAGVFGLAAGELERMEAGLSPVPRSVAATGLGLVSSAALAATSAEAALLHFRGAFQNPFMLAPVTLPPLAAAALAGTVVKSTRLAITASRTLLGASAAIGVAGAGFHAYGIARNMGGWRNWSQMILQGPPIPAPPAFTGSALAGLGALRLLEMADERR
ncbi:hypothetical protein [Allopontixanthobacter sp.]|uniref:hypothetical protein n=1 Tax=Allopontixanthobacter sp. TaxID=2906452 RepID=UPI002AB86D71|nr:hypothetical protein [Allopontixanthobacter sp.]MDZ4307708.1 hypothetical protein [Allopontixanthobacter sp.]